MRKLLRLFASLEIWAVGLCTAASFVSARLLPLAVACIIVFSLLRWAAYGRLSVRTSADYPILFLILMLLVTLWVTGSRAISLPQVLRVLTGIGLYYAIINWTNSPARIRWLFRGIWCAGCLLALYAFVSVQWNNAKLPFIPASLYAHFKILVSDTANPNVMAGSLVLLLPCALGVLWFCGVNLKRLDLGLAGFTVIFLTIGVFLSQSRGGLLALGGTLALMVVFRWRRGWWFLAVVAILVGGFLAFKGPAPIMSQVFTTASLGGIDGRLEVWSRAILMIRDFPFTGIGMGSFERVSNLLYPFFLFSPGTTLHAHNLFLQIAVDIGIPGLIAWLSILILMTLLSWLVYQHGSIVRDNWVRGVGAGLLSSQLALVSHGMLDATTWGMVKPAPLVWMVWGATVAAWYVYSWRK
jgi:putative inorganic carbon (HCO3(-)) transporter